MDDRLTVLHLIDTGGPGGAESVFKNVVTGLSRDRWRSISVVPEVDWLYEVLTREAAEPLLLPSLDRGGVRTFLHLFALARRHRVDLIHAHLLGASVYGSLAAASLGIPCICTFHGVPDLRGSGILLRTKIRILSRRRNRLVFVSESLRDWALERHRLPEARSEVVYNGIEPSHEPPSGSEREELGADRGESLILAVGNLRPAKDYGTLLRAMATLRTWREGIRLVIIGDGHGSSLEDLVRLRRTLGLGEIVRFAGFRQDVARLLTASDVVVSSSESEGFSLSIVEALWGGKPVVATRSGGPEEIIRHEETGFLVPVGDHVALAQAIHRVLENPDLSARMAEAGRRDVRRRFSKDRMLASYDRLYCEMLGTAG